MIACIAFVAVFACNSTFIPIPPPNPTFTQSSTGEWAVQTPPDTRASGAIYYLYNADLGSGLIQRASADGSMYAYPLQGNAGDRIMIRWEKSPTEGSSGICRPLGEGTAVLGCQ
jgi:hypothetical protein